MKIEKVFILFFLFLGLNSFPYLKAEKKIGVLDMQYTLQLSLNNKESVNKIWDDMHAIATLQGIVNRKAPSLYIRYVQESGICIDDYWWNKYRKEGEWLANKDTFELHSVVEAIAHYRKEIKGAVVYDSDIASTSNVASSIAGIEDLVAIRYDRTPNSLYMQVVESGLQLPVKVRLIQKNGSPLFTGKGNLPGLSIPSSGSLKNDPYLWFIEKYMKQGKCNTQYGAYYIDQYWRKKPFATVANHHTLSNHDFFVSQKAFFFDLSPWADEPSTDDILQKPGTDTQTLQTMLQLAYEQNKGKKMCYIGGFPAWAFKYTKHANGHHEDVATEWEFSRIISAYNAFKDADAIGYGAMANASFWHHFPLKKQYSQSWISRKELQQRGYLDKNGKLQLNKKELILFYVGDYDASSWITQRTPTIWDDSNRGKLPLMWSVSPVLQERAPMVLHYFRESATDNDYFAAADNGAGYLMPGMLQEPRELSGLPEGLTSWANHCKPYYKRWGLTITGFVIDGDAPALNEKGLDCYASFSPNGIVPQKCQLAQLHKGMPILKSDWDINDSDTKKAAKLLIERVNLRRGKIPFHWFRNILKTPSWYLELMKEVKQQDSSIELVEAPVFFELLRIYLEEEQQQ